VTISTRRGPHFQAYQIEMISWAMPCRLCWPLAAKCHTLRAYPIYGTDAKELNYRMVYGLYMYVRLLGYRTRCIYLPEVCDARS
jgi:hypothetical protein